MGDAGRVLALDELPRPPLFRLVDAAGREMYGEAEVGGEPHKEVGVLFSDEQLAREFSAHAPEYGMGSFSGLEPRELKDWEAVEVFAAAGEDYVLVVARTGSGLFYAGDVARLASEKAGEIPFPLYVISDEGGESPLISVEADEESGAGEVLVTALFSDVEKARAFKERATHLNLPNSLGMIEDEDGLRRHALVARQAGAGFVVINPEPGKTEATPIEELVR